jgi:hypothetical protein
VNDLGRFGDPEVPAMADLAVEFSINFPAALVIIVLKL